MGDCIFCKIIKGEVKSHKVFEDENVFAFLDIDINPTNEYHTLVIPKKHYENIFDIPEDELIHITKAIKKITTMFNEKLGINNIQIVNSSGKYAQQDVYHIHFHIVPRNAGDEQDIKWNTHPEYQDRFDDMIRSYIKDSIYE